MEHIGFALNAVLPSMMLLLLGAWLRSKNILSSTFSSEGDKLCFKILLPALVFKSIVSGGSDPSGYLKSIVFCIVLIAVSIVVGLLIVPRFTSNRKQIAVIIQGAYRSNYAMYGIAFSQLLGNDETVAIASIIAAATLPVLNTTSIAMYAHYTGDKKHSILRTLIIVMKNPIIWAILLALAINAAGLTVPVIISSFVKNLASITTPLAFILLGTRLTKEYMKADIKITALVLFVKLVVMPAIFLPVAVMMFNIRGPELIPVFLFAAAPCAVTTYQLAVQYEADERLAGNLVTVSTLVSAVSICFIISLLKMMELI